MKSLPQNEGARQPLTESEIAARIANIYGIQPAPIVAWYLGTLGPEAQGVTLEMVNTFNAVGVEFLEHLAEQRYRTAHKCVTCGMPCWRKDIPPEMLAVA